MLFRVCRRVEPLAPSRSSLCSLSLKNSAWFYLCVDGRVHAFNLPMFDPLPCGNLNAASGCTMFAVDLSRSGNHRLCLALRKKLVLFAWDAAEFVQINDLAIPEPVQALSFSGQNLCVGFQREYSFIHTNSGDIRTIFSIGRTPRPLVCPLLSSELLLNKDGV